MDGTFAVGTARLNKLLNISFGFEMLNRIFFKCRNLPKMILQSLCETIYACQIENSTNGCTCKVNYREIQSSE